MAFQILSLSGGGYLGLYTAAVLAELEARTGRRAVDMFDLFAGTSIGGIVAIGLAAGVPAADIRDAFIREGASIFGAGRPARNLGKALDLIRSAAAPRYSSMPLRRTIASIIGAETRLADLLRPTVVTSVNLTKGGPKVFKTGHHPDLRLDWPLRAVEVALATSAAPTYFPLHRIGKELFADGGLFANSPDVVAVHEAEQFLDVPLGEIRLLSVGTTTTCFAFPDHAALDMGIASWAWGGRLTGVIIGSQQALTHDMMRHRLRERYLRIDRPQEAAQRHELALDCASEMAKSSLLAMAVASVDETWDDAALDTILSHAAVDRPFINTTS